MAEHAHPTDVEVTDDGSAGSDTAGRQRASIGSSWAVAVCAAALLGMSGAGGWMWYQIAEGRSAAAHDAELVAAAKQGALNLTTIDYTTVDADIQRILDSSTGAFHDDFQKRSAPFVDAVKRARSTSTGSVIEAGLQDQHGDQAKVLVAVSVRMVAAEQPDPSPMSWRMQIMVEKAGDEIKMSDVQFVE